MKKVFIALSLFAFLISFGSAFADDFDALEGISAEQKQKLTNVQFQYKQEYDSNQTKIMDYENKLKQLKSDTSISPEQASLLISAYERNISVIAARQAQLTNEKNLKYKEVLTDEQYKQYQAQQIRVENAFSDFLRK